MKLKDFIVVHGTQAKAAMAIGITQGQLNRWLNGHNRPKSQIILDRLNALDIEI